MNLARHAWPVVVLFAVFAGLAYAIQCSTTELAGLDDYRHARYAAELYANGFQVFGHPFLPLTVLGPARADLWLGYHELLAVFLRSGDTLLARAKALSAVLSAIAPTTLYFVLRRRKVQYAALWALFAVVCCPAWTFRDLMLRPAPIALALCLLTFQFASEGRWKTPMVLSAAFAWLHVSAPLAVVMAALGVLGTPRGPSWFTWLRPVFFAAIGLALGLITRPDAAEYLQLAWLQGTLPLAGSVPHIGRELVAPTVSELFDFESIPLVLGCIGLVFAYRARRWNDVALFVTALVASLLVRRFADFLMPAALLVIAPVQGTPRVQRFIPIALAVSLLPLGWNTAELMRETFETRVQSVKPAAEVLAKAGGLVVNTNCFDFPMYYFHEPKIPFVCGYDPSFLAAADLRTFWVWEHLTRRGSFCEQRECDSPPSAEAMGHAMDALGARWLALGNAERDAKLLEVIEGQEGDEFVERYRSPDPGGVVLFERIR